MRKLKKILNVSLIGLIMMYILVILFPQFLFANKLDYKNFEVYYHTDIDAQEIKYVLDLSADLLKESELNRSTNQKVFITDSYNEFTFFALLSRKSFAVNYPVIQNIFLTKSDISQNTITSNNDLYNKRNLSGVIAHETIHSLLEDRLGLFRYKILPSWKNEGYADFVAKESSYNETKGLKAICNIDVNPQSSSYKYFEYKIVTAYLLEVRNIGLNKFLQNEFELDNLKEKAIKKYCKHSIKNTL